MTWKGLRRQWTTAAGSTHRGLDDGSDDVVVPVGLGLNILIEWQNWVKTNVGGSYVSHSEVVNDERICLKLCSTSACLSRNHQLILKNVAVELRKFAKQPSSCHCSQVFGICWSTSKADNNSVTLRWLFIDPVLIALERMVMGTHITEAINARVFSETMLKVTGLIPSQSRIFRNGNLFSFFGHRLSSYLPHDIHMQNGHLQTQIWVNNCRSAQRGKPIPNGDVEPWRGRIFE